MTFINGAKITKRHNDTTYCAISSADVLALRCIQPNTDKMQCITQLLTTCIGKYLCNNTKQRVL